MNSEKELINDFTTSKINNSTKQNGIDIVFENISYSVNVVDETQKSFIPCKKSYKKK